MEFKFPLNTKCSTNGKSLWSNKSKTLYHKKAEVDISDWSIEEYNKNTNDYLYGELRVFFNKKDWNISKDGLVYTDPLWIKEFRDYLTELGFDKNQSNDVGYSEQGMQGDNYISLDIGTKFIKQFLAYKEITIESLIQEVNNT